MNGVYILCLYISAGFINGSFVAPTKYIKTWKFENIWLQHALWAFIILPWTLAYFLVPQIFKIYQIASIKLIIITIICGALFGIGQVLSALAIYMIGIGLTFVVCLSISIGLGFLLPLVIEHREKILTPFGYVTITGAIFAILGLIISTYVGRLCSKGCSTTRQFGSSTSSSYFLGVILALLAGFFSAGQNLCFVLTRSLQKVALGMGATNLGAAIIMWPAFLTIAFIPYVSYMVFLLQKNNSFLLYRTCHSPKYFFLTFLMGFCWYLSLIFYSDASQLSGTLGPIIGWPIFMILIILTSNFWGWIHKEWKSANRSALIKLFIGISFLISAVILFSFTSYINVE